MIATDFADDLSKHGCGYEVGLQWDDAIGLVYYGGDGIPIEWLHEVVICQRWLHGGSMMDEFETMFDFSG